MPIPAALPLADRDQLFRDWAVPVTFRQLTRTVDPDTASVITTPTDISLEAVPGPPASQSLPQTAARLTAADLRVLFRSEDFADSPPSPADHILLNGLEYEILRITHQPTLQTTSCDCRRLT